MSARTLLASLLSLQLMFSPALAMAAPRQRPQDSARATPERNVEQLRRYVSALPVGSAVKVRLLNGKRLRGTLMMVDAEGVTVRPKTRIPEPEREIAFEALDFMELETGGEGRGTAVLIGVGSAVATFLSLWVAAFALIDD